jgi:hypothetical protein
MNACSACSKPIIFARMAGKTIAVEKCRFGSGDIALTGDLLEEKAPTATKVANATGYRLHERSCKGLKSFTKPFRRAVAR